MKKTLAIMSLLALPVINAAKTTHYADVKLTHLTPVKSEAQWLRAKQVTPKYPIKLAMNGVTGCGVFKLTVNQDGRTEDIELVASVPEKVIYQPAKKIIKNWAWQKTSEQSAEAEEKLIRLDFCMGGRSQEEAKARCDRQAKLQCK